MKNKSTFVLHATLPPLRTTIKPTYITRDFRLKICFLFLSPFNQPAASIFSRSVGIIRFPSAQRTIQMRPTSSPDIACLPACPPACLLACPPACLPACPPCPLTSLTVLTSLKVTLFGPKTDAFRFGFMSQVKDDDERRFDFLAGPSFGRSVGRSVGRDKN